MEAQFHAFLISERDRRESSVSRSGHFSLSESSLYLWDKSVVGPRSSLDVVAKKKSRVYREPKSTRIHSL